MKKIYPETLLQLMLDVLKNSPKFSYIRGTQPFLISFDSKEYYVYVKNLSSAYFRERPDTTRAQLPIREDFEEIKASPNPFIFLGYDQDNDVLVCWNYNVAKTRLNEKKSVSFYSRQFFQEEVSFGDFLRKRLKNGDEPILFKRKNLVEFLSQIDTFFVAEEEKDEQSTILSNAENFGSNDKKSEEIANPYVSDGKLLKITDKTLISQLKSIVQTNHTLEAMKLAERFYNGQFPAMKLKDWHNLIKEIDFDTPETITVSVEQSEIDIAEQHKIQFIEFMHSQNKSESIIGRYVNAITGMVTNLVKEYYAPEINSIFNTIEISLLHSWADQLLIRPNFIKLNTIRHRDYSCALNKYIEFAESIVAKSINTDVYIPAEITIPDITPQTCESLFIRFMQDTGLSEHSSKYYTQALTGRISDCIRKYLMPELQNIFSVVDAQLLLSWSQYLHRNQEFKEINTTGNRQYSCALSKYIQFAETFASDNTNEEKTEYSKGTSNKKKSHILRVICPNGRVIEERLVYKTLIEVIQCAGALKVQSLGISLNGVNLVSETIIPQYKVSQKPIGNGLYAMTCSDTNTKKRIIEQISEAFNMGLKVEKVSIV
jgi:hypothetical protein